MGRQTAARTHAHHRRLHRRRHHHHRRVRVRVSGHVWANHFQTSVMRSPRLCVSPHLIAQERSDRRRNACVPPLLPLALRRLEARSPRRARTPLCLSVSRLAHFFGGHHGLKPSCQHLRAL